MAVELFHSMKRKQGSSGWVAIKGDLAKAYDRVEWAFLEAVFCNHGFSAHWTMLIMQYISFPRLSLLLNGSPFGHFSASRGLRQGDPLSPFLFILVFDVLFRLLSRAESSSLLFGMKLHSSAPTISHLFFADDILLFGCASVGEVACFKECLETYSSWFDQLLNPQNSIVHFSSNVSPQLAMSLADILGMPHLPLKQRHLGLPLILPRAHSFALDDL